MYNWIQNCWCGGVTVGVGVGVGVGVAAGEGLFIATPLFQTSFVPDLTQVNFFPPETEVAPTFVHLAPALAAAKEGPAIRDSDSKRARNKRLRVMR